MKVILAHNYYGGNLPSGEAVVFNLESQMLSQMGNSVIEFTRNSDGIRNKGLMGAICAGCIAPWNPFSKLIAEKLIKSTAADVFHVHNTFPLFSPSVFYAAKNASTATVLTLHNFRTFCPGANAWISGISCFECINKRSVMPSLKNRCFRSRLVDTVPVAIMVGLHRILNTWKNQVDAFIALTQFQKDILVKGGIPSERIFVKPNCFINNSSPLSWDKREPNVLYVGRLVPEKGCHDLLEAWRRWGQKAPMLKIIGSGSEQQKLENFVKNNGLTNKVLLFGQLSYKEVQLVLRRSMLLIIPTIGTENFPMVLSEAYSHGVPVAGSEVGSLPSLIKEGITGTLFRPGDPDDMINKVNEAWSKRKLSEWGKGARKEYDLNYTLEANYKILMNIYREAIDYKKRKISNL
jgi:glycosyltransferase involved in cell wall biosynthesis